MGAFRLGLMLVGSLLVAPSTSTQELPEPGKLYVIQSTMDGGVSVRILYQQLPI